MKIRNVAAILGLFASGGAIACTTKPMPALNTVQVTAEAVTNMAAQGYPEPATAAAYEALDGAASSVVGPSNWRANNFVGNVVFRVDYLGVVSTSVVPVDKPCDMKAIDLAEPPPPEEEEGGTGVSGSFLGFYWINGRVFSPTGSCIWGCGVGRVEVGEVDPQ